MDRNALTPLVLGVGNPMFGDDGFGIAVIDHLRSCRGFDGIELLDGGTAGIYLLPHLAHRPRVWIVDAVRAGRTPGEISVTPAGEVPKFASIKLSEHQVTLADTLALLELLDQMPGQVTLLGVEPARLTFNAGLSQPVAAAIPRVAAMLRDQVDQWRQDRVPNECALSAA